MPTLIWEGDITANDDGSTVGYYLGPGGGGYGSVANVSAPEGHVLVEFDHSYPADPMLSWLILGSITTPDPNTGDFTNYLHSVVVEGVEYLLSGVDQGPTFQSGSPPYFNDGTQFHLTGDFGITAAGTYHVKIYRN